MSNFSVCHKEVHLDQKLTIQLTPEQSEELGKLAKEHRLRKTTLARQMILHCMQDLKEQASETV